jgi:flagellar hook-basal body complex protein FliE
MVEAIGAMQGILSELASLAGAAGAPDDAQPQAATTSAGGSFGALFDAALNRLDDDVSGAATKAQDFASGGSDIPLSDVMVSLEEANLSMQLASNVRDKVTAAYSDVMNMQI